MSTTQSHPLSEAETAQPRLHEIDPVTGWRARLFSPLWLCLLIALGLRVFLLVHTHGVIDGDEALVGIQAERILHGDFPVYFYGQAYMGSLEAYLIALLFAAFGPSVWTLRAEPILLSLGVVWLTWRLAALLTEITTLSQGSRRMFMTIAALCAALPPLYDGIIESRTYGGFIEMLLVILLLLISTLRLTRRWFHGASRKELAWRWAGIGFLVGLGLWIYPLIASAILAAGLWILGSCLLEMRRRYIHAEANVVRSCWQPARELCLALIALPAALLGMAPAIGWGATHQWANISFIFGLGGHETLHDRIYHIRLVTEAYATCIAPRIIGGGTPLQNPETSILHTFLFIAGSICITTTLFLLLISLQPGSRLAPIRSMVALPTLFALCTLFFFCISTASESALIGGCSADNAGRYAAPIMLALPFLFATAFTFLSSRLITQPSEQAIAQNKQRGQISHPSLIAASKALLVLALAAFLATYALTYELSLPSGTFQSNYCTPDPADNNPILHYLQQQHIHYFWANNLLAYPLVFKSDSTIIGADPNPLFDPAVAINRIPSYTDAVLHADRPSMLFVIPHASIHPPVLQTLDKLHVTYRTARFYSEPGFDVLVVTPLNHTVVPTVALTFGMFGCVSQS